MSSLIIAKGLKKATQEDKRELAEFCNPPIKCIKVKHKELCDTDRAIMGYQSVELFIRFVGGRRRVDSRWSQNVDGKPVSSHHLVFYPNKLQQGVGYLPDSEYNRKTLVNGYHHNRQFDYFDKDIEKEIRDAADILKEGSKARDAKYREQAKRFVFAERVDFLDELKLRHPKGWATTRSYKDTIIPEINQKLQEFLNADDAGIYISD